MYRYEGVYGTTLFRFATDNTDDNLDAMHSAMFTMFSSANLSIVGRKVWCSRRLARRCAATVFSVCFIHGLRAVVGGDDTTMLHVVDILKHSL